MVWSPQEAAVSLMDKGMQRFLGGPPTIVAQRIIQNNFVRGHNLGDPLRGGEQFGMSMCRDTVKRAVPQYLELRLCFGPWHKRNPERGTRMVRSNPGDDIKVVNFVLFWR